MKKIVVLFAAMVLVLAGCKKEGCTDPDAINFDSKAKKDCKCCEYKGDLVLWYNKTTADYALLEGITSVNVYLDGVLIGSVPITQSGYSATAPACGSGGRTFNLDMGSFATRSYTYRLDDQNGDFFDMGFVTTSANKCASLKIE